MSTPLIAALAGSTLDQGLVSEVWAQDLADGCRIRGKNTATTPTLNIITHGDIRHVAGTGAHIERGWGGAGQARIRFGPGQSITFIPANAPGGANDHGKTLQVGFRAITLDGASKALSLGQASPGYVSASLTATDFTSVGNAANVTGAWVYNSASATAFKDAGNPKDWYALAGGPYVFRVVIALGAVTAADVSFTATSADNLIGEIAAQLVALLNTALNTHNGTSGVAYAAFNSGTNAITITNTAISGNPALGLGAYVLTLTVRNAASVEVTDQFHLVVDQKNATSSLSFRMPPDFDIVARDLQFYRDTDLTASTLPDYASENRAGHWFANYGFTGAAATGGEGRYLDNDAGTARGYLAAGGSYSEITVQMLVAQMERTTNSRYFCTGISDDELQAVNAATFSLQSYLTNELAITPDQSSAWESGLADLSGLGAQILTYRIRVKGNIRRQVFLQELAILENHASAAWGGMTIKGLWTGGYTGTVQYDPTTGFRTRLYAMRVWNRALSEPENCESINGWRDEARSRGISLGQIQDVVIAGNADSLTAWRTDGYGSWPYPLFEDADFVPRLIIINAGNGGSSYKYLDAVGGEDSNNNSEDFVATETRRVIPAIRAAKKMGAVAIVFRADGTNNKGQINSAGVSAYLAANSVPSRARLRAAGAGYIFEHMTIARGGDATFDPLRQALNVERFARVTDHTIDGVADITGTAADSYATATAAMSATDPYYSTDGTHLKPAGQLYRKAAAKTLILTARPIYYALREDGGYALREDGDLEIRD